MSTETCTETCRHRRAWRILVLAGLAAAVPLGPPAVEAQRTTFQEELDVNLVNVDVVVVDKKGNLITDLTREDFQIIDDGKKVEVEYFARLGEASAAATAPSDGGASSSAEPSSGARAPRNLVVFIDVDSALPLSRNRVLDSVSEYLAANAERTTAMVVTYGLNGLDIKQPFTPLASEWNAAIEAAKEMPSRGLMRQAEQRRLVESIKSIQRQGDNDNSLQSGRDQLDELMGSVRTEAQSMEMDGMATIRAMQTLVSVLSTVEGPKSLLYVGDGVPVHPGEELYTLLADVFEGDQRFGQSGGVVGSPGGSPGSGGAPPEGEGGGGGAGALPPTVAPMAHSTQTLRADAMGFDLTNELRMLTATANSHRVTLYGVSSDEQGGAMRADMNVGARARTAAMAYEVNRTQVREQSLRVMALETGGLALPGGAGVEPFLDRVLADDESRYSLGYLSPHGGDSRFHKIKVKVSRKGVELRHREGYIDRPRDVRIGDLVAGALLLGSGENPHQLEMMVTAQTPAENDEIAVTLGLQIPLDQLRLVAAGDRHETKLDIYILSKNEKGVFAPMRSAAFTIALSAEQMEQAKGRYYGATLPLQLKKGPHAVAVGMVEEGAQRTSVVRTELVAGDAGAGAPAAAPKS